MPTFTNSDFAWSRALLLRVLRDAVALIAEDAALVAALAPS